MVRTSTLAIGLIVSGCGGVDTLLGDVQAEADVDPSEQFPGGDVTNTWLLGIHAFSLPAPHITTDNDALFFSGNGFFDQAWVQAPASTKSRDGLGPLFNARSCSSCHFRDGRGQPPTAADPTALGLLLRLSVPGHGPHGAIVPEPSYGGQLHPFATGDVPAEGSIVVSTIERPGHYADGEPYVLLEPSYAIADLGYGAIADDVRISPRVAPAVFGVGLLEAIVDEDLTRLADPDDLDGDGISGRANRVWDVERGQVVRGRFGWKAEQPTVRQQSAGAFLGDLGLTTSLFPQAQCTSVQVECAQAIDGGSPEVADALLLRVDVYQRLLAVPVRQRVDDPEVLAGRELFRTIGCADCHTPSFVTAAQGDLPELTDQRIWPYTDLLLHDMGPALSDHRPTYLATGAEWRTPPLWGLRLYPVVSGHDRLLHDGRARGVAEAILWHGGEGETSREAFRELSATQRGQLVAFVESL